MSRRGTPWLGAHAPRAASSRGWRRSGWRRRPLQPPGQKLGVEPRTCAWCSDSTSAPAEAAGAWLRQASEPTTLAEVYMQISCTRAPSAELCLYREWCTLQSARAPPLIRVWCLSRVLRYYYYHFLESKKESAPRRPRAARLSLEFRARQRAASRARHFSTSYLCRIEYAHTLLLSQTIIVRLPTREGHSVRVKDLLDTAAAHKGGAGAGGWEHREHISGYAGRALTRRPRRSSSLQSLSRRFLGLQEQRLGQRWRGRRRGQEQTEQAS